MLVELHPQVVVLPVLSCAVHTGSGKVISGGEDFERIKALHDSGDLLRASDVPLLESGFLVFGHDAARVSNAVRAQISSELEFVGAVAVMPTEKCNFRCTYCYETFEKGRMQPALVKAVKGFLAQEVARLPMYSLSWFGGEPLLAFDIIDEVSTEFRRLQALHESAGALSITTNGSLLNSMMVKRFAKLDLNLAHISVDGPKETHNRQRRSLNQRDTYEQILGNIEMLLEGTSCDIMFRVNVDTRQCSADQIGAWLADSIVPRFSRFAGRVNYHAVSIWDASTTAVDGICLNDVGRFQTLWYVRKAFASAMGRSLPELLRTDMHGVGALACYAGRPNHYVIGSEGTIYKCTVAFDLDINRVGSLGTNGVPSIEAEKEAAWVGPNVLTDSSCVTCRLGSSCLGLHCPLTRMQTAKPPCPSIKRHLCDLN